MILKRFLFLLTLICGIAYAQAQTVPPNGCTTTTCTGTVLPAGFLSVSGNQIRDGVGNNVRLSCVEYRGGSAGAQTVMNAISAAGFNCVRIGWRDRNITNPPAPADCSAIVAMQACVTAAANATAGGLARPLKVILAHYGNETPAAGSLCLRQQQNGLPYDLNGAAPYNILASNTDGCGNAGTITYVTFRQNWINYATTFTGNSTVVGFDLHNEPLTYGNGANSAVWGTGGGGGGPTPPAPAAANGFNTLTYGPTITPGTNWFLLSDGTMTTQPDGSVRLSCSSGFNGCFVTAAHNSNTKFNTTDGYNNIGVGRAFGGGFYVNYRARWTGTGGGGGGGWPALWANDTEGQTNGGQSGSPIHWPGQAANYTLHFEPDVMEDQAAAPDQTYGSALWVWYGTGPFTGFQTAVPRFTYPTPTTRNSYNNYGFLWKPATLTSQGRVAYYFNDVEYQRVTWNFRADRNTLPGPPPTVVQQGGNNGFCDVCSDMDFRHQYLEMGSGTSPPIDVISVSVWQANTVNNIGPGSDNPPVVGSNGADLRAIYSDVGAAVIAANPGVLIIAEGPITNKALFSGTANQVGFVGDLSTVGTLPLTGIPTSKVVYSVHTFPCNFSGSCPDTGAAPTDPMPATINSAWGYLEKNGLAPVFIGELGCSCEGVADDQTWANFTVPYLNGLKGAAGGPTFAGTQQPFSASWFSWGNNAPENPSGTLNGDGTLKGAAAGQAGGQAFWWSQLLYTPLGGGGGGGAITTWDPAAATAQIVLSVNNTVATSSVGAAAANVRSTTSKTTGKFCWEVAATTISQSWKTGLQNSSYSSAGGLGSTIDGVSINPNSNPPTDTQIMFFNGGILNEFLGNAVSADGDPITGCADFANSLVWFTSAAMRAAGNTWNNSPTANPATGVGGASIAGLTCPCFIAYDNFEVASATINPAGPFAVATPAGFTAWDTGTGLRRHVGLQFGMLQ